MFKNPISVTIVAMLAAVASPGQGRAQGSAPNISGTYRCSPEPAPCHAPAFSVSQTGPTLEIKAENGPLADGKLTSDITLSAGPPWNTLGVILRDHSIQWSDGTHWRKE
jgi:hypothetical protein